MSFRRGKSDLYYYETSLFTVLQIGSVVLFRLFLPQNLANTIQDILHSDYGKISACACDYWRLQSIYRCSTDEESIIDKIIYVSKNDKYPY
jgi:hypothetical protein